MDSLNRLVTDFTSWDELNQYVGMKRSEPYKKYFQPMEITEEQKKRRGIFAEKIEDDIVYLMAFLFYIRISGKVSANLPEILNDIRNGYVKAYGTPDEYIESRSQEFGNEIVETTNRHADDPYFYSKDRAVRLAEEEANTALNHKEYVAALSGYTRKQWVTIRDGRERESHGEIAGTTIPIGDLFYVGDSIMAHPRDMTYSPSPGEVINCRCSLKYLR